MDNVNSVLITTSAKQKSTAQYQLKFPLTEQQLYAANKIVEAIKAQENLLLDAVTGAGKTEMIFKGIQYARQHGLNVAVVSPRVDVVIEVSLRLVEAFEYEDIDIIYEGHPQQYNGHFVVATVQQLLRFKKHFDVVFIDEVDAFPLAMDLILMKALTLASCPKYSHIYMTATPPKQLLKTIPPHNQIKLPARYHRRLLPVPTFKYLKIYTHKIHPTLVQLLKQQIQNKRITLVFVNNIIDMKKLYQLYRSYIEDMTYVYSEDSERYEKIADLRAGKYKVIFTTTILERGFTMEHLDVIVLESHLFLTSTLIQIAGRVGRKLNAFDGLVLFCHQGVSWSMIAARRKIKHMNHLAIKKGWVDA
ncbi:DEAD/DEAH box helicase family protein [Staphylococcus kloosii]|uniref:DEAD/DEAH box helicase family protein n=1 Tax=Staphylococcus kloosii TaxID=29384 RepID=UPI001F547EAD|nr:DEAD/DEAH box helicase family protein [Staphylococcus kloosii]